MVSVMNVTRSNPDTFPPAGVWNHLPFRGEDQLVDYWQLVNLIQVHLIIGHSLYVFNFNGCAIEFSRSTNSTRKPWSYASSVKCKWTCPWRRLGDTHCNCDSRNPFPPQTASSWKQFKQCVGCMKPWLRCGSRRRWRRILVIASDGRWFCACLLRQQPEMVQHTCLSDSRQFVR